MFPGFLLTSYCSVRAVTSFSVTVLHWLVGVVMTSLALYYEDCCITGFNVVLWDLPALREKFKVNIRLSKGPSFQM